MTPRISSTQQMIEFGAHSPERFATGNDDVAGVAARAVLAKATIGANSAPDPLATHVAAISRLASAVREHLPDLEQALADAGDVASRESALTTFIASLPMDGIASVLESRSAQLGLDDLTGNWRDPAYPVLVLARTLWHARVRPQLGTPPTIPLPMLDQTVRVHFVPGRRVRRVDAESADLLDRAGRVVAVLRTGPGMPPQVPAALLTGEWLKVTETLTGHRLFRWLAFETTAAAVARQGDTESVPVLRVAGGLTGLARAIGEPRTQARGGLRLPRILDAFQFAHLPMPKADVHGLLTWFEDKTTVERNGKGGELVITPTAALMPSGGRGKLVPVALRLPKFWGAPDLWPVQATLQLLLLVRLREHARELARTGSATLTRADLKRCADEARLPMSHLARVLDTWQQGQGAFLTFRGRDRWDLGTVFAQERACIIQGGVIEEGASAGGRARAAARRHRGQVVVARHSGATFEASSTPASDPNCQLPPSKLPTTPVQTANLEAKGV